MVRSSSNNEILGIFLILFNNSNTSFLNAYFITEELHLNPDPNCLFMMRRFEKFIVQLDFKVPRVHRHCQYHFRCLLLSLRLQKHDNKQPIFTRKRAVEWRTTNHEHLRPFGHLLFLAKKIQLVSESWWIMRIS